MTRVNLFRFALVFVLGSLLLAGCGHMMHPKASEYLEQAKDENAIQTMLNITQMMKQSLPQARDAQTHKQGLDTLHEQYHALKSAFCLVNEAQAADPSYVKAATISREMRTVFHRLWKYRKDQVLRDVHLDLFGKRIDELEESLQAVKV